MADVLYQMNELSGSGSSLNNQELNIFFRSIGLEYGSLQVS